MALEREKGFEEKRKKLFPLESLEKIADSVKNLTTEIEKEGKLRV